MPSSHSHTRPTCWPAGSRAEQGFDEALLVTRTAACSRPHKLDLLGVGRELLTPPLDDHILASITRARVIELTGASERPCTLEDLQAADEAFLASTTREVQPVGAIDAHTFERVGPVTERAAAALRARIEAELAAPVAPLSPPDAG